MRAGMRNVEIEAGSHARSAVADAATKRGRPACLLVNYPLSLINAFLIGTPKRLKIAVTLTKQTIEVVSNRYSKRGVCEA